MFIKGGLRGIDLNKPSTKRDPATGTLIRPIEGTAIPESMGLVSSTVYVLVLSAFIPFAFAGYRAVAAEGPTQEPSPYLRLCECVGPRAVWDWYSVG